MKQAKRVVLIDNYDSFTWNLYEYMCREGAEVRVYRNDEVTVEEVAGQNPDLVFISPGPGHPGSDSGICKECIRYFTGKVPVFGVCMGLQCIFEVFGGEICYAGEVVHGKTSEVWHDGKGVFRDVAQGVPVTRYHSLAGTNATIPEELEVSARTANGIIMGVRHKKYAVEGVQFHPESILTEDGRKMIKNILNVNGAASAANEPAEAGGKAESILERIYKKRMEDVEAQGKVPGLRLEDLQGTFDLGGAPPVKDFYSALEVSPGHAAVIAEVKRSSPSKGPIAMDVVASEQALRYAKAGAAGISVLTEPHWFNGCLQDLVNVRKVLDATFSPEQRPCILRKDFVFSKYQILEARLAGADTVLLIVKMLSQETLKELYDYATLEMRMEPLVEVNCREELDRALELKAKVIGVNNRNLHSFTVDLNTTSKLVSTVPKGTRLLALSGISKKEEALSYRKEGVQGLLVGEALMRAKDAAALIQDLSHG